MENPLHHFELHPIWSLSLFGFDVSVNQAVVMMWIVVAGVALFFILGGRRRQLVPSKLQNLAEMAVLFLRQMVLDTMGPQGLVFLPFLIALFFFILFSNLFGLCPGAYTVTSQVMVTGVFALAAFVLSFIVGFWYHGPGFLRKVFA
ncbi:MAG: F0F1 ATP synthase subunit A, partial [Nitrospirota bacterium]